MYDICRIFSNFALEFVTVLTVISGSRFQQYIFIFIKQTSTPIATKSNLETLFKVKRAVYISRCTPNVGLSLRRNIGRFTCRHSKIVFSNRAQPLPSQTLLSYYTSYFQLL